MNKQITLLALIGAPAVLVGGFSYVFVSHVVSRRRQRRRQREFANQISREQAIADEEFLAALSSSSCSTPVAVDTLKIRNVIAKFAEVPPTSLSPTWRISSVLQCLPFWDDPYVGEFLRELGRETAVEFTTSDDWALSTWYTNHGESSLANLIGEIQKMIARKREKEGMHLP